MLIQKSANKDENKNTDAVPTQHETGPTAEEGTTTGQQAQTSEQPATTLVGAETTCQQQAAAAGSSSAKNKSTSEKKIRANRSNGLRSPGPKNTERTRYNAMKHGLLSKGLTPLDNEEAYDELVRQLTYLYPRRGPVNDSIIQHVALDMMRLRRSARIEAEIITSLSSQPTSSSEPTSDQFTPTIHPIVMKEYAGPLLGGQRYETAAINRMFRCLRQLEHIPKDELKLGSIDVHTSRDQREPLIGGDDEVVTI